GDKLVVCQYRSNGDLGLPATVGWPAKSPFYVHSKTWIFDDEYLITGSANCNRRGYSHDSELDIGVYDPIKTAVRDLRIRLWLRRLNTERVPTLISEADVRDPIKGAVYWEKPTSYGLTLENHRDLGLDRFLPGSGGNVVPTASPFDRMYPLLPVLGQMTASTWLWDTVVDPDGA
ncbi:MAG TPA: phospholipase D-like domain-containing protein, partial [Gaiellales bacterium]|nr:phospholipase D-like domain-containing protein [Gaiellales bacterium]